MRRSLNVRSAMRLGMFVSALVGLPVATSLAAITVDPVANDVSPTNPATWTSSTQAYVGNTDDGKLTVDGGSQISSGYSWLGYYSGSTGTVTVDGAESAWNADCIFVGNMAGGIGRINVTNGGMVSTKSLYASLNDLYGNGTINVASGAVLDGNLVFDKTHGLTQTLTFGSAGQLILNMDGTGCLGVGYKGTGSLRIADGVMVTSASGEIGVSAGSTGTVTVDGAGSKWINSGVLYIAGDGTGELLVTHGGTVSSRKSCIGYHMCPTGTVTVDGAGSTWNAGDLTTHDDQNSLTITRGGLVTASSVSISNLSLDIGFDSTLNINNGTGTLTNNGKVRFTASANVAAGEYQPILAGTFAGSGIYQALGGRWDNTRHVFIVDAAETGSIDNSINLDLTVSRRAAITDATSGQTLVGASFLTGTGSISFAASDLSGSEESALSLMLTDGSDLLAGYQFTVTGTTIDSTNPVYLSLFVGRDYDEDTFKLWHYDGTTWTAFIPTDLSYDGLFASFTVTGFSGYAISGELIPEPASLGLLAISSVGLLLRRRS